MFQQQNPSFQVSNDASTSNMQNGDNKQARKKKKKKTTLPNIDQVRD
jgi:hypothetical protein